ncbi:hypothetical protein K5I29_04210 [Flavobacterium agricola]|uniref:Uncharacterized protein n=1 Tax=Flavobacterium agricola TaxID=2870839 RepID=A0ABY6M0R2_9FLAO|nr:hypothetical protein [Flavobacterium agricola]UYW02111.1 hypothetical protein K5I29_04210 [Flavobacterium agricola]
MASYKGIEFAEGLNVPFAKFKEMFASHPVFKKIPTKELDAEFKKAYKIANPKHGNFTKSAEKSKKTDVSESIETDISNSEAAPKGHSNLK